MLGSDFLKSLRSDVARVGTEYKRLLDEIETRKLRLDFLATAPLPRADFAEALCRQVDEQRGAFSRNLKLRTEGLTHKPDHEFKLNPNTNVLTAFNDGTPSVDPRALIAVVAEPLKEAIRSAVDEWDWPDAGPPLKERIKERVKLERELKTLEKDLATIDDEASAVRMQLAQSRVPKKRPAVRPNPPAPAAPTEDTQPRKGTWRTPGIDE